MKLDLEKLASEVAAFAGLKPEQSAGLAILFLIVEREAYRDGVLAGRERSYAEDPGKMHESYGVPDTSDTIQFGAVSVRA